MAASRSPVQIYSLLVRLALTLREVGSTLDPFPYPDCVMAGDLKGEFQYYLAHQTELVKQYNGKFVVIQNHQVVGVYDDQMSAITETQKTLELGTFLVQKVTPGSEAYTQTFHSRVAFA